MYLFINGSRMCRIATWGKRQDNKLFTKLNSMKIVQLSDNVDKVHYLQSLYIVSINYNVLILLMLLVRQKEDSFNHGYQSSNI